MDHTARWGGGEVSLQHLVVALDRCRVSPAVVLLEDGPLRQGLEIAGIPVAIVPLADSVREARKDTLGIGSLLRVDALPGIVHCIRRLARVIRLARVDVVHTNSLKSDVLGGLAARWAGVPVLWHVRDRISEDYLPRSAAAAFRGLCRVLPTAVVANSRATMATLGSGPAGRSFVVHNGTPVRPPGSPPFAGGAGRHPVVGTVGRLTEWKGQHVFLNAAAAVLRRFPAARFQLIGAAMFGETEYERRLRRQVARLGIGQAVEFRGFCHDTAGAIAGLDVLAHASVIGEPFGQVLIEGMMAGRPVVATAGGGVPEIIEHGTSGLLVPMGDAAGMADAIGRLLGDVPLARRLGLAGRDRALKHFTIDRVAGDVMALYDHVLGRRPGPGLAPFRCAGAATELP